MPNNRNEYLAKWRALNRDKTRAAQAKYYAANRELCDARVKDAQKKNRAYYTAKTLQWQRENPDKVRATRKRSYEANREAEILRVRKRAGKIKQGALWTTPAEQAEIEGLYLFCRCFPKFEVDHVIPLNGEGVSGLHVLDNLQVLLRAKNRSKGNKFCSETAELTPQHSAVIHCA